MTDAKPAKKAPAKEATKAAAPKVAAVAQGATSGVVIIKGKPVSTRGRTFTGIVISDRMSKSVTVEWERKKYVPKYQRYEKRRTRVKAHDELGVKVGDKVELVETRPISKTKNFLVTKKLN
jgi:small subunit ribosomal protein S17